MPISHSAEGRRLSLLEHKVVSNLLKVKVGWKCLAVKFELKPELHESDTLRPLACLAHRGA